MPIKSIVLAQRLKKLFEANAKQGIPTSEFDKFLETIQQSGISVTQVMKSYYALLPKSF